MPATSAREGESVNIPVNCTFWGNSARFGGGIHNYYGGTAHVWNNLLGNNHTRPSPILHQILVPQGAFCLLPVLKVLACP